MTLPAKLKESIILKVINRGPGVTIKSIAQSNNVGLSTLDRWVKLYRTGNHTNNHCSDTKEQWLEHLLNTKGMDDVSLGAYCRKHGIYSHQLTDWKQKFMSSKDNNNDQNQEIKKLKDRIKNLDREVQRKDKALAEASALLILKKKADLIWGDSEDDL